ncbi:flavodoxin family protein [Paractinoplanes globisporus]|uniref:Flavodoxin family protein n=1 Tax=Paractinoplanes globisporus TaxID=113565 RepID=A0ABW6WAL6_9ACTN|nr:flavodoxin domain-containing protein [Actinoplanes globisporus]
MKALIVYESMFGNTAEIARAVADGLAGTYEVTLADAASDPSPDGVDLLVVGGPTHAFGMSRPSSRAEAAKQGSAHTGGGLREYLDASPALRGVAAATFDTRIDTRYPTGSAARKAQRRLRKLGCRLVAPAESFRVTGTEGPLLDGETDRARKWATTLGAA